MNFEAATPPRRIEDLAPLMPAGPDPAFHQEGIGFFRFWADELRPKL